MTPPSESAIVTGAAGGLGIAITRTLIDSGRVVIGMDRSPSDLAAMRRELPDGTFFPFVGDVTSEEDWSQAVKQAEDIGRTTVLVNNAGISPKRDGTRVPGLETGLEMWYQVMDTNLTGAFLGIRAAAPEMLRHGTGRIVNISSMAGRTLAKLAGIPYSVSKAGMLGLTRAFAGELGPAGITVNAIAPGRIKTAMLAAGANSLNANILEQIPARRFGNPNDIAEAVRFLASDEASFVTGVCIDVNGGQFMA